MDGLVFSPVGTGGTDKVDIQKTVFAEGLGPPLINMALLMREGPTEVGY